MTPNFSANAVALSRILNLSKHAWIGPFSKPLPVPNTLTMVETVFSGVASDADVRGTLFQGIKFWISQKVPMRSRFLNDVKVKRNRARAWSQSYCLLLRRSMVVRFIL